MLRFMIDRIMREGSCLWRQYFKRSFEVLRRSREKAPVWPVKRQSRCTGLVLGFDQEDPRRFSKFDMGNFLLANLIPVTIGNIIGGAVMVAAVYWFVYLRLNHTNFTRDK